MYAIMGVTGQVGRATATHLLDAGHAVRAIVRDAAKASSWSARGAEIAVADWNDTDALTNAFHEAEGVFVMLPANFAPAPDFSETRDLLQAMTTALQRAKPRNVVALSSIGAQHDRDLGLITQLHLLEQALDALPLPRAYVRAGWFMENLQWDVAPARDAGRMASYLQPLDRAIPLIATDDIGRCIAQTLTESWSGRRVIELEGPQRYSPQDMAQALARACGRPVEPFLVPRDSWAARFESEGMPADRTGPRIAMLDGFNSGWIDFALANTEHRRATTSLEHVVAALVHHRNPS